MDVTGSTQAPSSTKILDQPAAATQNVNSDNEAQGAGPDGDTDRDDAVSGIPSSGSRSGNSTSTLGNNVNVKV